MGAAIYERFVPGACKYTLPVWALFPWIENEREGWLSWN